MEAYIDISYIFHLLLCINSFYLVKMLTGISLKKKHLILIEITSVVLYINVLLYPQSSLYLNIFYFILIFYLIFKGKFIKPLSAFLFSYYSSISIIRLFTNNIYLYKYILMLHTPNSFFYIFIAPLITLTISLITKTIKSLILLKKYKHKVSILIKDKTYELTAYFDSGNTLKYKDIPVIFISDELKDKNIRYEEMTVSGIGKERIEYLKGKIFFNNQNKDVYCAYVKKKSFNGCQCLLNVYLL